MIHAIFEAVSLKLCFIWVIKLSVPCVFDKEQRNFLKPICHLTLPNFVNSLPPRQLNVFMRSDFRLWRS